MPGLITTSPIPEFLSSENSNQARGTIGAAVATKPIVDYAGANTVISSNDLGKIVSLYHDDNSTVTIPLNVVPDLSNYKSVILYNNSNFDIEIVFTDGAVETHPIDGLIIKSFRWVELIERSQNNWMVLTSGGAGGGETPTGPPPVSLGLPTVSGFRRASSTLTAVSGGWQVPPTAVGYQWFRDEAAIVGATNLTYVLTDDDSGSLVTFKETAINTYGSTTVSSVDTVYIASQLKSFATDIGITPTNVKIRARGVQNCVRVFVEKTGSSMREVDIYIKENGGATKILKAHPTITYALAVDPGTELSFATSNGRPLKAMAMLYTTSLPTSFPVSGTAATDKGGPSIWTPVGAHVTFPNFNSSFEIVADGVERHVFISEFDGSVWSPPKWIWMETTGSTYLRVSSNQIAFLTSDGANLSINGVTGTAIGGTSHAMHLPMLPLTGTLRICSNVAEFKAALAASVYGDRIGLNDATYVMDIQILRSTFVANHGVGGRSGGEGIMIYSVSGNRAACIITGDGTGQNGNWVLGRVGSPELATPFMMKDITLDHSGKNTGFMYEGGIVYLENIHAFGPQTGTTDIFSLGSPSIGSYLALCLNCDAHDALNDVWNTYAGTGGVGHINSKVLLINCKGYRCGNLVNSQNLTTHTGFLVEMELGELYDSYRYNVQSGDLTDPCNIHWVKTDKGTRDGTLLGLNMFGCRSSDFFYDLKITPGGYCIANKLKPATIAMTAPGPVSGFQSLGVIREAADNGITFRGNLFDTSIAPAYFTSVSTSTIFDFNVILTPTKGILFDSDIVGALGTGAKVRKNTVIGAATAFHMNWDVLEMGLQGNASKTSTVSIQVGSTTNGKITSKGYNTFDPTISASYTAGTGDLLTADAALTTIFRPVVGGNCQGNVIATNIGINWFGAVDWRGIPLVFGTKMDRGALAYIEVDSTQDLYPDVWV